MKIEAVNNNVIQQSEKSVVTQEKRKFSKETNTNLSTDTVTLTDNTSKNRQLAEEKKEFTKEELDPPKSPITTANRAYDYYINKAEEIAIKVLDKETKEVIKEIPSEEEQRLSAAMKRAIEELYGDE